MCNGTILNLKHVECLILDSANANANAQDEPWWIMCERFLSSGPFATGFVQSQQEEPAPSHSSWCEMNCGKPGVHLYVLTLFLSAVIIPHLCDFWRPCWPRQRASGPRAAAASQTTNFAF